MNRETVQGIAFVRNAAIASLLLPFAAVCFETIEIPFLPQDEEEAAVMLQNGELDAAVWNVIREFYTAPINVPRGELVLLQELFSDVPADLPVEATALSRYEPWGQRERARFFERYPDLEPFAPILSFDARRVPYVPAHTGLFFSRRGLGDTARQFAAFSIGERKNLAVSARVDFSDAHGRWRRRTAGYIPLPGVRIDVGNFVAPKSTRVVFGHFPASASGDCDSSVTENWLYATAPTWNGIRFRYTSPDKRKPGLRVAETFIHEHPTERIAYVRGDLALAQSLTLECGASRLLLRDGSPDPGRSYLHLGASAVLAPSWRGTVATGMTAEDPFRPAPFIAEITHRSDRNALRAAVTFLPAGFKAPRSRVLYVVHRQGLFPDSLEENAVAADVFWSHPVGPFYRITPQMHALFRHDGLYRQSVAVGVVGVVPFYHAVKYGWSPAGRRVSSEAQRHYINVSMVLPATQRIMVNGMHSAVIESSGMYRMRTTLKPVVHLSHALDLWPLCIASSTRGCPWEYTVGIGQTLALWEKTFSEFSVEQPLPFASWEHVRAQGRMSFMF